MLSSRIQHGFQKTKGHTACRGPVQYLSWLMMLKWNDFLFAVLHKGHRGEKTGPARLAPLFWYTCTNCNMAHAATIHPSDPYQLVSHRLETHNRGRLLQLLTAVRAFVQLKVRVFLPSAIPRKKNLKLARVYRAHWELSPMRGSNPQP